MRFADRPRQRETLANHVGDFAAPLLPEIGEAGQLAGGALHEELPERQQPLLQRRVVICHRLVERSFHGAFDHDNVIVPVAQPFLHFLEASHHRRRQFVALRLGQLKRVTEELSRDAELVRVLP